jgi:predicted amidophosphoribosyltransferase
MTCARCRKPLGAADPRCPHCGKRNPANSGTFQSSTVLISAAGSDGVYRSVEDVPPQLRTQLLKSTNGANSATILIADRRGRREIARMMRKLPSARQRRLANSLLAEGAAERVRWLTPERRMVLLAAIVISLVALILVLFTHRW